MEITRYKNFILEQETPQEKTKKIKAKSDIDQQLVIINETISKIDLAIANLINREKEGTLSNSESLTQQATELQRKVAELQKKANLHRKLEDLEK